MPPDGAGWRVKTVVGKAPARKTIKMGADTADRKRSKMDSLAVALFNAWSILTTQNMMVTAIWMVTTIRNSTNDR
jgi:hypothetical protein